MFLTFLNEFEEDLDKDAVFGCFQRVIVPISRRPAGGGGKTTAQHLSQPSKTPKDTQTKNNLPQVNHCWRAVYMILKKYHLNVLQFTLNGMTDLTHLSWGLCRRSHIWARQCPQHPPTRETQESHLSQLHHDWAQLIEPQMHQCWTKARGYLIDVLEQIQRLFEVILVGSSVVITDVQLERRKQLNGLTSCMLLSNINGF